MRLEIEFGGAVHVVEMPRADRALQYTIDGVALIADCVETAAGSYSVLLDGRSFEASVEAFGEGLRISADGTEFMARIRDPRKWRRNHSAAAASEHRQNVVAPMPGRVVRVLVAASESVETGQGIIVVEAMKMQNEVRSPKAGRVERLLVKEGQAINAGETIAVVA